MTSAAFSTMASAGVGTIFVKKMDVERRIDDTWYPAFVTDVDHKRRTVQLYECYITITRVQVVPD